MNLLKNALAAILKHRINVNKINAYMIQLNKKLSANQTSAKINSIMTQLLILAVPVFPIALPAQMEVHVPLATIHSIQQIKIKNAKPALTTAKFAQIPIIAPNVLMDTPKLLSLKFNHASYVMIKIVKIAQEINLFARPATCITIR